MSIRIDSCAAGETIVVNTRSSVYELIVLPGDQGDVLVRGGRQFTEFCRARFIGSIPDGGSLQPWIIDVGLRMQFICEDRCVITSAVESLSCRAATPSADCVAAG